MHRQLTIRLLLLLLLLLLPSNDLAPQVHQSLPQCRQRRRPQIIRNVVVCVYSKISARSEFWWERGGEGGQQTGLLERVARSGRQKN